MTDPRLKPTCAGPATIERPIIDDAESTDLNREWVVRVFNNEVNTYDEVISILIVATDCSVNEAYTETWEIDHLGSSVVHHGKEPDCTRVAKVIRTIGIQVEVVQE